VELGSRYDLIRELGRGGMGVVYLGRDRLRDMPVAIKVLARATANTPTLLKREFRTVAGLCHPNLVELYELVATGPACYFTMEYVDGRDLRRHVLDTALPGAGADDQATRTVHTALAEHGAAARAGLISGDAATGRADPPAPGPAPVSADAATGRADPASRRALGPPLGLASTAPRPAEAGDGIPPLITDWNRLRGAMAQLAEGLAYLHARGLVHRDVKPSNALVGPGGVIKLLDFGLAVDWQRGVAAGVVSGLVGTAPYLAPEYVAQLVVSPAMDMFALGVLGFELATGSPPFLGGLHELARAHRAAPAPRARALHPEVPADLDDLLATLLTADPRQRPGAVDVLSRLAGVARPRARREPRLVGRDREVAELLTSVTDPATQGRIALVAGPSGIGKSALVEEVVARAPRASTLTWRGRCHEREQVPYRALDPIIDDIAGELVDDERMVDGLPHPGAVARAFPALFEALVPALHDADAATAAADPQIERERAFAGVTELIRRLLRRHRGLIVIDDLQWCDHDSLELIRFLAERIGRPLTVIATFTTGPTGPTLADVLAPLSTAQALVLAPLPPADVASLVAHLAPGASPEVRAALVAAADGSPFVAELLAGEYDSEAAGAASTSADAGVDASPERRRVARLGADERVAAEIAAVAVAEVGFDQVRHCTGWSSVRVHAALRALVAGRVLRTTPSPTGEVEYAYYHSRLRPPVLADLGAGAVAELHRRHATWLEGRDRPAAEALAEHWQRAGYPTRGAGWALRAAEAAAARLAFDQAAGWYERALASELPPDRRTGAQLGLADAQLAAGRLAAAAGSYLRLADDLALAPTVRLPARLRAAEAMLKLGEIDRGLALIDDLLAAHGQRRAGNRAVSLGRALWIGAGLLGAGPPRRGPAPATAATSPTLTATYRVIASFLSTAYPVEALEYALRTLAAGARTGDDATHALGMSMLAGYLAAGTLGRAGARVIRRAIDLAVRSGDPYARMTAAAVNGLTAMTVGDFDRMRAVSDHGAAICSRMGLDRSWEASFLRTYRGLGELHAGYPRAALAVLALGDDHPADLFTRSMAGTFRARAYLLAGELPQAEAVLAQLDRDRTTGLGMIRQYYLAARAELALAQRDWTGALEVCATMRHHARRDWLATLPAVGAMIDTLVATAALGQVVAGGAAARAAHRRGVWATRRIRARAGGSLYGPIAHRLRAQLARAGGERADEAAAHLATAVATLGRASRIERALVGHLVDGVVPTDLDEVTPALGWLSGGLIDHFARQATGGASW
jgi:hypothetical protein